MKDITIDCRNGRVTLGAVERRDAEGEENLRADLAEASMHADARDAWRVYDELDTEGAAGVGGSDAAQARMVQDARNAWRTSTPVSASTRPHFDERLPSPRTRALPEAREAWRGSTR